MSKFIVQTDVIFLHEAMCCGYSIEAPRRGALLMIAQNMFSLTNKKNIFLVLILILSHYKNKVSLYLDTDRKNINSLTSAEFAQRVVKV